MNALPKWAQALLIISVVGVAGYFLYNSFLKPKANTTDAGGSTPAAPITPTDPIFDQYKQQVWDKYQETLPTLTDPNHEQYNAGWAQDISENASKNGTTFYEEAMKGVVYTMKTHSLSIPMIFEWKGPIVNPA